MVMVKERNCELLQRHGMTRMFGNPGSNGLPFLFGLSAMPADPRDHHAQNGTYGTYGTFGTLRVSSVLSTGEAPALDIPGIGLATIAEGYGVTAQGVQTAAEFSKGLREALLMDGPVLIEVEPALPD